MNVDLLKKNPMQTKLLELMFLHSCQNVIDLPTRISQETETLIDHCFTNFSPHTVTAGVVSSAISDHMPFFGLFSNKQHSAKPKYKRRTVNEDTVACFCSLMAETCWAEVYLENDPSVAYDIFLEKVQLQHCISYGCRP